MIEATLQWGDVPDADSGRTIWKSEKTKVYARCSLKSPLLAWPDQSGFIVEEFDFAGQGIPGVQVNNALLYEALCYGTDGDLQDPEDALAKGFRPITDGGRGQFQVSSLDDLKAEDW